MKLTLQDMRDRLKGQRVADRAIFWYCNAWHTGRDSELYQIMREVPYSPFLQEVNKNEFDTPEYAYCFQLLTDLYVERYGRAPNQTTLRPVPFNEVREDDVLTHTKPRTFPCIEAGWPCRVYLWGGDLHVACAEDKKHRYNHQLRADERGLVVGFLR
jgi:hypothetical protein